MNSVAIYVGVDVSKRVLDIDPFDGKASMIKNTSAGIHKLIQRIQVFPHEIIICCESSGGYEKPLITTLMAHGVGVTRVNACRVRRFAQSRGMLAKTDTIDAKLLSLFGEHNKPRLLSPLPDWQKKLKALLVRREELIAIQQQERCRLEPHPEAEIRKMINRHLRVLENLISATEKKLRELISAESELNYKFKRLCAVNSLGFISALSLLAFLPELGEVTNNQAAALAGLAPYNNDSGTMKGKRYIQGGRIRVRNALYMAAVSASTHNHILKQFYRGLIEKGKPPKVAITAVMRKMVVLANRLMADPSFQIS